MIIFSKKCVKGLTKITAAIQYNSKPLWKKLLFYKPVIEDEEEEAKQTSSKQTETNLNGLRRTIYLTLQSSLNYEEATDKLLKLDLEPGQEVELCNMILDCSAQQRTYEKFYGLVAEVCYLYIFCCWMYLLNG
ncbi:ncm [Bugula neritina]|uniref:Ncm n=1 Tax=Bugula neritina TaxID=10212 RepID=A0A7J7JCE3_BUGNE|nr:ncm [Bugula neritina]